MKEIKINVIRNAINVPSRTIKTDADGKVGAILPNGTKVRMTVAQMCGVSDEPVEIVKDPEVDALLMQSLVEQISDEMDRRTR